MSIKIPLKCDDADANGIYSLSEFLSTDTISVINLGSGVANSNTYLSGDGTWKVIDTSLMTIQNATTSVAGIVQLSDTTSSTNTSLAATANSVKTVYDLANSANVNASNASYLTTGTVDVARLPTIPNSILENGLITINTGSGLSGGSAVSLGNSITISANSATTTTAGIVQLNDSLTSSSTVLAATANSVKTIYDLSLSKLNSNGGTISGDLIVSGDLTVNGNTTTLNVNSLAIEDNIIELRTGNNVISGDGGIQINLTTSPTGSVNTSRSIKWNNSVGKFQLTNDGTNYSNVIISSDTASTSSQGIVQLNDTLTSSSTVLAATANSVRTAYDMVNSTNVNASNASYLTTGTVGVARLPTIPNSILQNNSITVSTGNGLSGGSTIALGNSITISANSASTTTAGIVQLNDSLTSSSTSLAATANAVRQVNVNAANASYLTSGTISNSLLSTIPNSALQNNSIIINGSPVQLGGSISGIGTSNLANTTIAGIVQLNDTLTSSSTLLAATANTVKTLNDKISTIGITGGSVVGNNIINLVNPNANSFIKINQNNSVSALNSGDFRTAIGAANILKIYKTDGTGINVSLENDTAGIATTNSSYIALTSGKLNQFTNTTSSELAGIITDETGTGNLVFSNNCILNNPTIKLTSNTIVANLSSELLNNQPGSYYTNASNLNSGKIPIGRLGDSGTANSSTYLRGDNTWQIVSSGLGISDTTNNATYYPTFANVNTGTVSSVNTSSSKLYFNPSDGTLTSTNYSSLSDRNLKEDINLINNSLEMLKLLQPVSFKWKDNGKKSYGLVAQEVQEILPELVETDSNGIKSVNYTALIPFLINAIVELSA